MLNYRTRPVLHFYDTTGTISGYVCALGLNPGDLTSELVAFWSPRAAECSKTLWILTRESEIWQ